MTTLEVPITAAVADTPEAQEARWNAWKAKGAASDRIAQSRMRLVFAVVLIAMAGVMIAVVR